ncbi:2-dehydropantoate 2-reductase [Vagococcus silagei]|uniref:2-dehydropantoate 2-reductase n=1 Tax=Vagococcus silagei TaxID=2508885 RepID=A0A4S3B4J9_9ENTE|nr:2-dehydropantoate 2-reductase [Vagococcus silagei]THB61207.1 2-dehydropantoate 2-reductase [Vagococcus silagei]
MKIIIAGSGAMGSRFGLMLHRSGNDVILVDGWKEHIDKINNDGLQANLNGEEVVEKIPAYHQDDLADVDFSADLVILFTKAMQLETMLKSLQPCLAEETKVLCLLNGIGHEDIIKNYVKFENIFIGNTMWTAGMDGPGRVTLFGSGSLDLQNLGAGKEEAAKEITKVLSEAELHANFSEDILASIYRKACVNGTMNGLCTMLNSNMTEFGGTTYADDIVEAIVTEFVTVAKAQNIELDQPAILAQIKKCYDPETIGLHHPSMYQDLIINNRLTEIDYINGAIVRKGKEFGISTPYCAFLTQLIHVKEEILGAK